MQFFGSRKEPNKSLCGISVCVSVFNPELKLSLALSLYLSRHAMTVSWLCHGCVMNVSWICHECVLRKVFWTPKHSLCAVRRPGHWCRLWSHEWRGWCWVTGDRWDWTSGLWSSTVDRGSVGGWDVMLTLLTDTWRQWGAGHRETTGKWLNMMIFLTLKNNRNIFVQLIINAQVFKFIKTIIMTLLGFLLAHHRVFFCLSQIISDYNRRHVAHPILKLSPNPLWPIDH